MIKQFYCIVDAGGNIYEHSFSKTESGAKWKHFLKDYRQYYSIPLTVFNEGWKLKEENGDRVVLCDIDTKEEVKINVRDK